MKNEVLKWINFSETDLNVAVYLNNTYNPKPMEIICYHCQQSAEKAIKALFIKIKNYNILPKTHNLSFLLQQLEKSLNIPEELYDMADSLTPYSVAARYPNELFIEEDHVMNSIKNASEILKWAKNNI